MPDLVINSNIQKGLCIGRPCISLAMFSALPLRSIGGKAAQVIEHFLEFVPPGSLGSIFISEQNEEDGEEEGHFHDFDRAAAAKLSAELSGATKSYNVLIYGGPGGTLTGCGIRFEGWSFSEGLPEATNLMRLDVPLAGSKQEIAGLLSFAAKSFEIYPAFVGTCGLSFNYNVGFEFEIRPRINALVMRYLGLDITYDNMSYNMKGRCPPPNWLTFVGDELLAKLGGRSALAACLGDTSFHGLAGGVLIQAAARPPVGDVNRRARDIGALPKIARILKPLRIVEGEVDIGFNDKDHERRWLARFDDLEDQPWDNWAIDGPASSGGT